MNDLRRVRTKPTLVIFTFIRVTFFWFLSGTVNATSGPKSGSFAASVMLSMGVVADAVTKTHGQRDKTKNKTKNKKIIS